ncbi:cysteine-rich repeat secretory protein 38-like [Impatiens glandulifera]|uniref:cysteine-rich repeat secretory protein 38-like n=1 Tax=Impatiens glandulifera TaxID=253017 RepID=UPI001FB05D5E|nr:cysteine-rich repeat secretory protein 38-like [Impatiens glandulifera]
MGSQRSFVFFILASIFGSIFGQQEFLQHFCMDKNGFYTRGSVYEKNLNTLLSRLPSLIDSYGYSNSNSGKVPDRANAVVICRGDVSSDACRDCVKRSVPMLTKLCPTTKAAVGWLDYCMLRYSSGPLTGPQSISPNETFWVYNDQRNTTSPDQFNKVLQSLLEDLKPKAAAGGSRLKFAAGNRLGPDFQSIYAIVQCAPDLSAVTCSDCLTRTFSLYPICCDKRIGGRVITPNCNFRYEIGAFYNQTRSSNL